MSDTPPPPIDSAQRSVGVRACGACDRPILSALGAGGTCHACERPICLACWRIDGQRACRAHASAPASERAAAQPARTARDATIERDAQVRPRLFDARDEAAAMRYVARFEQKLGALARLPGTDSSASQPRPAWRRRTGAAALDAHDRETLVVRAVAFQALGRRGDAPLDVSLFVLTAAHEPASGDGAHRTAGLPLTTLVARLRIAEQRAARGTGRWVLGLAALEGWSNEAVALIVGDAGRGGWVHPRMLPVLVDLASGRAHASSADPVARSWRDVLAPPLPSEMVDEAAAEVSALLDASGRDYLPLRDLVTAGIGEALGLAAFRALAAAPGWRIDDISGVGTVIVRTALD